MPDDPRASEETNQHEQPSEQSLRNKDPEQPQTKKQEPNQYYKVAQRLRQFFWWWDRDRCLNMLTFIIASTTIVYAYFSYHQWQTMKQQMELSERPWLGIEGMNWGSPPFVSGKVFTLVFTYKNFGTSPALYFRSNTFYTVVTNIYPSTRMVFPDNPTCVQFDKEGHVGGGVTVMPTQRNTWNGDYTSLDDPTVAAIRYGTKALVVMGCFVYEDQFKKIRHTKFCEFTLPNPKAVDGLVFDFCPSGQYAD